MRFKIYNCDIGFKYNGVSYDLDHVDSVVEENPQMNNITRGANGSNKVGLVFKEGIKEPITYSFTAVGISQEIKALLDTIYDDQERVEFYVIDRTDGSSKIGRNAILKNKPRQLSLDETAESMNVEIIWASFDVEEVHKS
jgi:chemotaxis regulatin CheY-phosphate phosphatase CheZ